MEDAVPCGKGAMAVLLGLDLHKVESICQNASQGEVVEAANLNCPGQIVISGERSAVKRAMALGKMEGARRVVELEVSGPFHSSLMRPIADVFAQDLALVHLDDPKVPLVANVTADYVEDATTLRRVLLQQLYSPVRWEKTIRRLLADGVDTFVEVGPVKYLRPD